MSELVFIVYGTAAPAGSKRVVPAGGRAGGRPIVIDDSKRSTPWKRDVAKEAAAAMLGRPLLEGAIALQLRFYLPRPKGHYGVRGVLPSAPHYPIVRPDVLKLARGVEDALTGIVWRDDAQIVIEALVKRYGDPARVEVTVMEAPS